MPSRRGLARCSWAIGTGPWPAGLADASEHNVPAPPCLRHCILDGGHHWPCPAGVFSFSPSSWKPRRRRRRPRQRSVRRQRRLLRVRHECRHAVARLQPRPSQREAALYGAARCRVRRRPQPLAERERFAYTALPPNTARRRRDAPADLWLALRHSRRRCHGSSPAASTCWWRRCGRPTAARGLPAQQRHGYSLFSRTDRRAESERVLVSTARTGAVPGRLQPDGETLYYVALSNEGTRLSSVNVATASKHPSRSSRTV